MKKRRNILLGLVVLALLLASTSAALAGGGGPYVPWSVIGGGGGTVHNGIYEIQGNIGQASTGPAANRPYVLCAGFWCGMESVYKSFLPVINR